MPDETSRRWMFWAVAAVVLLLIGVAGYFVDWDSLFAKKNAPPANGSTEPLTAELTVFVRAADGLSIRPIDEPDALPVRPGSAMSMHVRLNQPVHMYLVWLDSQGRTMPLYPWNMDQLEALDVDQPPERGWPGKGKVMMSPETRGKAWTFGKQSGMETVLFLARRTPLPEKTRLANLLALPPAKMRLPGELVLYGLDHGAEAVSTLRAVNRGAEADVHKADEPLHALMKRLQDHFDLIRALRFANAGA